MADSAYRVRIILNSYGNIAKKSYDKETADITNLLHELKGNYARDVDMLNLREWVDQLERANQEFDLLRKERYTESADKTEFRMKIVRLEIDNVYDMITGQINTRVAIEGEEKYHPFVKELNLRIDHYKSRIAQRKGRKNVE
jgi:molecular chaperone GrpE (heat shock protein)